MTKKHLIMTVVAALALVGCADDYNLSTDENLSTETAISFAGVTGKTTRATGAEAAEKLNNSFVVYAFKTTDEDKQVVYDYYNVNYAPGSATSSTTNTAGWEYVGQTANVLNTKLTGSDTQDIKYWDMAADSYDFIAFSAGTATQVETTPGSNEVQFSTVDNDYLTSKAYTITGAVDDLTKVYIADRVTATADATTQPNLLYPYKSAIQFAFKPLAAKVNIGLYEDIPGYSVTGVQFYEDPEGESSATTALYAATDIIPSGKGIVNVSFPEDNKAQPAYNKVKVTYDSNGEKGQSLTLGTFAANKAPEDQETGGSIYLGRTSSTASMALSQQVVPATVGELKMKIDFTLVSIDYNETINITGAVATVPAQFTNWLPNHAYTYLFKLSDLATDEYGRLLYPITFDALEITDDWGVQQTISTIDQPSITTYAKGALPDGNYYHVGDVIYVCVTNGQPKELSGTNSKLYTATATDPNLITENNIIENINDLATFGITLTDVSSKLTIQNYIDAKDSSTGDKITAAGNYYAKFTGEENTYVFEFTDGEPVYYQTFEEYNQDKGTTLDEAGFGALSLAEKIKIPADAKHYKVIRVKPAP